MNSSIREASKIANATEFIESHLIENAFDDSAESLYNEIERNKETVIQKIGKKAYDEAVELLDDLKKDEAKKGKFVAVEGDIDRRGADKKDL